MSFIDWLFGGVNNPYVDGRWGLLHILTLVICVGCIFGFYFIVKKAKNPEKMRSRIICTMAAAIAFFEIMIRFVRLMSLYYFQQVAFDINTLAWVLIPRPWCAISCWLLMACVFVKKPFFYNFASLSALLCSVIFFSYPGVGYNSKYILFDNLYSIVTHALLLTMSITLIVLKFTDFRYKHMLKLVISFALTFVYALFLIYVLEIEPDPMYFMPGGDIQEDILGISYGLYLFLYCLLLVVYVNAFHLVTTIKAKRAGRKEKALVR